MIDRFSLLLPSALLAAAAVLPAQNACLDGGVGSTVLSVELDTLTGNNGHLGVESLGGEYFVSSRGIGAIAPHKIYVFDGSGSLLRSFDQPPATAISAWGMRDLATDGVNLFGGDENGVYGFDAQGNVVTQVVAANGNRALNNLTGSVAEQVLGTFRALAFDRDGNSGEGSFWSANFASDLVEFDLSGNVLQQFSNTTGWSLYGLALDSCANTLWGYAQPADGNIVEISPSTGQPTGREIEVDGVQGGLAIFTAPGGLRTWFARIDQTSPDLLHVGVLHQVPGICDGLELYSQVDAGPADRSFKSIGPGHQTLVLGTRGTPANAPVAIFFNLGADALVCGDVSYLGAPWQGLADLMIAFGISQPPGLAIAVTVLSGAPLALATNVLPANAATPLRAQAVWLDARVPGSLLPVLATNEVEFLVDRRPPLGIVVEAIGANSFNANTSSGFFAVTNPTSVAIHRIGFEAVGGMMFDFAQTSMADRFDGGSSTQAGCLGTFRNGSDSAVGLDYASTPASPCDPTAHQPHLETGSTGVRLTMPFAGGAFQGGVTLEWDVDTDGGIGNTGAAMDGMRVTVELVGGDVRSGVLALDPAVPNRAFVVL